MNRKIVQALFIFLLAGFAAAAQNGGQDETYFIADKMPEFEGGRKGLTNFIKNKMQYPAEAKAQNITGTVYVKFAVEKNGQVGRAEVVRGEHPSLNQEALRIVNAMPQWTPGIKNRKPVAVWQTLPVKFPMDK